MNDRDDVRRHLKAAVEGVEGPAGPCAGDDLLIDYFHGRLAETTEQGVRAHLVRCPSCRAALRDVSDFFAAPRPEEGAAGLSAGDDPSATTGLGPRADHRHEARPTRRSEFWGSWWWLAAAAAGLLLGLVPAGLWIGKLIDQNRRLAVETQAMDRMWSDRLRGLEAENQRRQAEARQWGEERVARARPQANIPIFEILPRDAVTRSAKGGGSMAVKLSPVTSSFVLILDGGGQPEYPPYRVELLDARGRVLWEQSGLARDPAGNFNLVFDRAFLGPGIYRLRLFGQARNGRGRRLGEYLIDLAPPG